MATAVRDTNGNKQSSFWDELTRPRPYILTTLIVIGIILEICIYYFQVTNQVPLFLELLNPFNELREQTGRSI